MSIALDVFKWFFFSPGDTVFLSFYSFVKNAVNMTDLLLLLFKFDINVNTIPEEKVFQADLTCSG